ncbi:hypothetical protein [Mesomycoplasma neurolyticum]|uniref:hypothetical protein n=1 Tax=Mesomycoplasma neurolyticum TaxID=2120 RepID=UPI00101C2328|nr:hypothetical protein [Mesomycoplasma neurolyticum]
MKQLKKRKQIKVFLKKENAWEKYKFTLSDNKVFFLSLKFKTTFNLPLKLKEMQRFEHSLCYEFDTKTFISIAEILLKKENLKSVEKIDFLKKELSSFIFYKIKYFSFSQMSKQFLFEKQAREHFNNFSNALIEQTPNFNLIIQKVLGIFY